MSDSDSVGTIYTVGHSTYPLDQFVNLLARNGITALTDVRSSPYSRFNPQFNKEPLKNVLEQNGIRYVFLGKELGARSKDPACYVAGRVSYKKLSATISFRQGIERLLDGMKGYRVAMMCAERDPLECHRTILVSRELEKIGVSIAHILQDGSLETNRQAMERLLVEMRLPSNDLFRSHEQLLEEACDKRGDEIAYADESRADATAKTA